MNGLVSVIIPVYNVAPYLIEALESVINQTYKNLEIIVIDDGSTDESGGICDDYSKKDNRINIIHQSNKGLSSARNIGLNKITGDMVAFLDADDVYRPDYIQTMVSAMYSNNVDLIICKFAHYSNKKRKRIGKIYPLIKKGIYERRSILNALVNDQVNHSVWNKLYKKELWENTRFPDGHVHEDDSTTYKILDLCKTVYVIDLPLYLHRSRQGSISKIITQSNVDDWISARLQFEAYVQDNVPDLFNKEQLVRIQLKRINQMIIFYYELAMNNINVTSCYLEHLRNQIIELNRNKKLIARSHIEIKIAFFLMHYFPKTIPAFCPVYHKIKFLKKMIRHFSNF